MPRVVVRDGLLFPLEPLPKEWTEGQEVEIVSEGELVSPSETEGDDVRWAVIEQAASEITIQDFAQMQAALDEADRQAKDWMRRRMGLTE